ncbi:hypothetical protein P691DRAFT_607582, partial [Macrolepiota fuliginosa MF-IS2]
HAQARNVIEHIFGVLKHCFRILLYGPEYHPSIQALIPTALAALHNFIWIHDPAEGSLPGIANPEADEDIHAMGNASTQDIVAIDQRRDQIATDMWNSYQAILQEHRLE